MRYLSLLAVCVLLLSCNKRKLQTDAATMYLKGPVKSIIEKDYFLDTVGEHKGKTLRWINYYAFNNKGMLTTRQLCNDRNDTISRRDYFYDSAGKLQNEIVYADGILMYRIVHIYDSAGNNTFTRKYRADDSLACTDVYIYNKQKLCVAAIRQCDLPFTEADDYSNFSDHETDSIFYNNDGLKVQVKHKGKDGFIQTTRYNYDDKGNCIGEITDTTRPYQTKRTERRFDEMDRVTEETSWEANNTLNSKKSIQYLQPDKNGNATVIQINWHDLGPSIAERTITYY